MDTKGHSPLLESRWGNQNGWSLTPGCSGRGTRMLRAQYQDAQGVVPGCSGYSTRMLRAQYQDAQGVVPFFLFLLFLFLQGLEKSLSALDCAGASSDSY